MNIQQVVASEQLRYEDEISIVSEELKQMGMRPTVEIRIYPLITGWYATALVDSMVFIFTWHVDRLVVDIQPFSGFDPTGGLIH